MRLIILLLAFLPLISFSQTRRQKPLVYKTIQSNDFAVGDRISLGSVVIQNVEGKYKKYSVLVPESFEPSRNFLFDHPEMEFRVVIIWQQMGRKFPGLTETVEDTLVQYFRKPDLSQDNRLYINSVYNSFSKKVEGMQVDLEVLSVGQSTVLSKNLNTTPIISPENKVIYRRYKNPIIVDTTNIPQAEAIWIEDPELYIKYSGRGKAIVRLSKKRRETLVHVYSGTKDSKQSHGVYIFDVQKLPDPDVFLDGKPIKEINVSDLKEGAVLSSKYADDRLPGTAFKVGDMQLVIAGKTVKMSGNKVTKKVAKAIEKAPVGSDILIRKIVVNGSGRYKFYDVLSLKK